MKQRALAGALACLIAFVLACGEKKDDVLVKVDGSVLTVEEFKKYIPDADLDKIGEENVTAFLRNWADQEVLYLEAKKRGLEDEDSVRMVIEQYKKNLLAMELVRREFGTGDVSDSEIVAYFESHKDEFLYAVKLGQIVLGNMEAAQTTLAEIRSGADFYRLARERSLTRLENPDNPTVMTDYIPRGSLGDFAIEEVIFNLKPGEVSEPIPYLQGTYLIVKMVDRRKMYSSADLTRYRPQIYNYLVARKYQDFLARYVDTLRTRYQVNIDIGPLKK